MRTIRFDPDAIADPDAVKWWADWRPKADKATDRVLQRWNAWLQQPLRPDGTRAPFDPGLQQKTWSELKDWLNANIYDFRCAYCEGPLDSDRYKGDAEHFRPKGRVTTRAGDGEPTITKSKLPDGSEFDHPGYFWLAYDWRNLVPACAACNSGFGKVDQFPVKSQHMLLADEAIAQIAAGVIPPRSDGFEAHKNPRHFFLPPARLDAIESPLLLNPLNPAPGREPSSHLRYGIGGLVVAVDESELGAKSIEVFQLKREQLRKRRQEAQETLQLAYYGAMMRIGVAGVVEATRVKAEYESGRKDFSTAALDYLTEIDRLRQGAAASQK